MKVFVMDAAASVRTRLVARLREGGLEVIGEADTVGAALVLITGLGPDGIVTDVRFSDRRGPDVVRAVRGAATTAVLVVLSNDVHLRRACLAHGADHFLDKSADFDAVTATLRLPRPS